MKRSAQWCRHERSLKTRNVVRNWLGTNGSNPRHFLRKKFEISTGKSDFF
jgi:hypothetical protein